MSRTGHSHWHHLSLTLKMSAATSDESTPRISNDMVDISTYATHDLSRMSK
jgi:hypothetical protein